MSLAQIQQEAADLTPEQRRQLMAFLVSLQTSDDPDFQTLLANRIDDKDPTHWVDLEDLIKVEKQAE